MNLLSIYYTFPVISTNCSSLSSSYGFPCSALLKPTAKRRKNPVWILQVIALGSGKNLTCFMCIWHTSCLEHRICTRIQDLCSLTFPQSKVHWECDDCSTFVTVDLIQTSSNRASKLYSITKRLWHSGIQKTFGFSNVYSTNCTLLSSQMQGKAELTWLTFQIILVFGMPPFCFNYTNTAQFMIMLSHIIWEWDCPNNILFFNGSKHIWSSVTLITWTPLYKFAHLISDLNSAEFQCVYHFCHNFPHVNYIFESPMFNMTFGPHCMSNEFELKDLLKMSLLHRVP